MLNSLISTYFYTCGPISPKNSAEASADAQNNVKKHTVAVSIPSLRTFILRSWRPKRYTFLLENMTTSFKNIITV